MGTRLTVETEVIRAANACPANRVQQLRSRWPPTCIGGAVRPELRGFARRSSQRTSVERAQLAWLCQREAPHRGVNRPFRIELTRIQRHAVDGERFRVEVAQRLVE